VQIAHGGLAFGRATVAATQAEGYGGAMRCPFCSADDDKVVTGLVNPSGEAVIRSEAVELHAALNLQETGRDGAGVSGHRGPLRLGGTRVALLGGERGADGAGDRSHEQCVAQEWHVEGGCGEVSTY
jgi:hypothetical protein